METEAHILIAEDDRSIREGLVDLLSSEGYRVTAVEDGNAAIKGFRKGVHGLVILDIMMPGKTGFDVCKTIRKEDPNTPILFLSAKGEEVDKVLGLELGADDYLAKPFGLRECLARVRALLRRAAVVSAADDTPAQPDTFSFCAALIDRQKYTACCAQRPAVSLTAREMRLIEVFLEHADRVLTRDALLNLVWGIEYYGTTRTLDQHVAQLRKKCELDPAHPVHLITVHAVGYRYASASDGVHPVG